MGSPEGEKAMSDLESDANEDFEERNPERNRLIAKKFRKQNQKLLDARTSSCTSKSKVVRCPKCGSIRINAVGYPKPLSYVCWELNCRFAWTARQLELEIENNRLHKRLEALKTKFKEAIRGLEILRPLLVDDNRDCALNKMIRESKEALKEKKL
jgi:hypothetical protein